MAQTRFINRVLGTHYTLDEVAEMDPLVFTMLDALWTAWNPKPKGKQ